VSELIRRLDLIVGNRSAKSEDVSAFVNDALSSEMAESERGQLVERLERDFIQLNAESKTGLLYLLGKLNPENAAGLAKKHIEQAYREVRRDAGFLHQILICIDNEEPFLAAGLSAMDVDKSLRLAYAIVNNIEIKNGDFRPDQK
jgi:hypothetical protein